MHFQKEGQGLPDYHYKIVTPTLSPNSHGDTFATNAVAGVDEFVERCALSALAILSGKDLT